MITREVKAAVQVDVPHECAMRADFTPDVDLRFQFGEPGRSAEVIFERLALERFLHLAVDMLAAPWPGDESGTGSDGPDICHLVQTY